MGAAQTIAAAIEKLEGVKAIRGVTGPTEQDWLWEVDPNVTAPDEDPRVGLVQGGPDAMLHRTIDAQIEILRRMQKSAEAWRSFPLGPTEEAGLDLARAILGEQP